MCYALQSHAALTGLTQWQAKCNSSEVSESCPCYGWQCVCNSSIFYMQGKLSPLIHASTQLYAPDSRREQTVWFRPKVEVTKSSKTDINSVKEVSIYLRATDQGHVHLPQGCRSRTWYEIQPIVHGTLVRNACREETMPFTQLLWMGMQDEVCILLQI